jgi:hexosaminidase
VDQHSPLYAAPFDVKLPVTVKVATFAGDGSLLAASRQRVLDRVSLSSRSGDELDNCGGSDFRLRIQPMPDATSLTPAYPINLFDSCQLYPKARLDGVVAIHVDVVRLVRNYALAGDQKLVVSRPHTTPFGELVVHQDQCAGPVLATLPLPDPAHSSRSFALDASLPAKRGEHTLCLIFTAPITGPLYALGRVELVPVGTKP